jgi:hypothetical protein
VSVCPISVVYACYNQPLILRHHLDTWGTFPADLRARLEFVLVDDASAPPLHVTPVAGLDLKVLRVTQDIVWNYGAKNLAMSQARHPWALLSELDHLLTEEACRALLALPRDPRVVYRLRRRNHAEGADPRYSERPHPGTFFLARDTYWSVGGTDEDFSGHYGYDDIFLAECLRAAGCSFVLAEDAELRNYSGNHEIADADHSLDPAISHDLSRNRELFERKQRQGRMRAAPPILRFPWRAVLESLDAPAAR